MEGYQPRAIPFAKHLGIRFVSAQAGRSALEVDLRPELMNSWRSVHGGVTLTLLDIAMAMAARSLAPDAVFALTVEMKTSFIGAAEGRLVAHGRCIHLGKYLAFCEAEARDAGDRLIATSTGTFQLRRGEAAAGEEEGSAT